MQTVAADTVNIPNSNPTQQINAINNNMNTVVEAFNQLQGQLVNTFNLVLGRLDVVLERVDLLPMRIHNAAVPASGRIKYPPNIVVAAPLPVTVRDALMLTGAQYLAAVNALRAANAPGLGEIANNVPFLEMQNHFLGYLGIAI